MAKVRYGIENVYYALIGEDGGYETPKPLKGAVSIALEAQGNSNTFYCDDSGTTFETNTGYSGTLTIASMEDDARVDLLSEVKDSKGGVFETTDSHPKEFALLYKIKGNVCDQNFAFFESKLSRPPHNANTTSDSTEPDTVELPITCSPHEMTVGGKSMKVTKYSMERSASNADVYDAWYEEVKTPQVASA